MAGCVLLGGFVQAEDAGQNSAARASPDRREKILQLWRDVPDYVAELQNTETFKKAPQLASSVSPTFPFQLPANQRVTVLVSFAIDEKGSVEAARVLESSDVRFNDPALDAVRQWSFIPAENDAGPVRSFRVVPIVFQAPPPSEEQPIGLSVGPVTYLMRIGPRNPNVSISLTNTGAAAVRAGRVIITAAQDDAGGELHQTNTPSFHQPAVGSVSIEDFSRTPVPSLSFSLTTPLPGATALKSVEGIIELVIPTIDPDATARIAALSGKVGSPLVSPALRTLGLTVVVFDKAICDRYQTGQGDATGGPGDYDVGPFFGPRPPGMPDGFGRGLEMQQNDLAVGIDDPQGKLIGFEFQTVHGEPLHYNHNGWYHSGDAPGKRFSVYRLPSKLPDDATMVCWLITPESLVKVPLKLANLPLPQPPPAENPPVP